MPDPARKHGIALCLSGGGYRAAIFHLGGLRRLNELGILSQVETISSVSGGSITAAFLATRLRPWPEAGQEFAGWDERVAEPLRGFASRDIRTGPVMRRLLPWNWFRIDTQVRALAGEYYRHLSRIRLKELPWRPRFIFCATDVVYGANWEFSRCRAGDYQAGYVRHSPSLRLADAVAASSCFPPVFDPWHPPFKPAEFRDGKCRGQEWEELRSLVRLTDGGVYDNMGLEPVWKNHKTVLVSDGGAPFSFKTSTFPLSLLQRYAGLMGRQSSALRKRWLISNFEKGVLAGAYWGVGSDTRAYPSRAIDGYSQDLVSKVISRIRTDIAPFSRTEIAVLENHGYLTADAAVRSYVADRIPEALRSRKPFVPHKDLLEDEDRVKRELNGSDGFFPFGRRA